MSFKSGAGIFVALLAMVFFVIPGYAQKDVKPASETIICPVSGETVLKSEAAGPHVNNGETYYFCCNDCLTKFKAEPEKFTTKSHDVICGHVVDKNSAKKVTHNGTDYYFCSDSCVQSFEKDPGGAIEKYNKAAKEKCEKECNTNKAETGKKSGCCSTKKSS